MNKASTGNVPVRMKITGSAVMSGNDKTCFKKFLRFLSYLSTWFRGYENFSCSAQLSMKFQMLISLKKIKKISFFSGSDKPIMLFALLIVVKTPTRFLSRHTDVKQISWSKNTCRLSANKYGLFRKQLEVPVVAWWCL